jgi:hypothetical protein
MSFNHGGAATSAERVNQRLLGPFDVADCSEYRLAGSWTTRRAIKVRNLIRFRPEDVEDFLRVSMESAAQPSLVN